MAEPSDLVYYACTTPDCEFKGIPIPTESTFVDDITSGEAVCGYCHQPRSMKPTDPPKEGKASG